MGETENKSSENGVSSFSCAISVPEEALPPPPWEMTESLRDSDTTGPQCQCHVLGWEVKARTKGMP